MTARGCSRKAAKAQDLLCGWQANLEALEPRTLLAGGGENIVLVVNPSDENALRIANAYQQLRGVPDRNIIFITPPTSNGSFRFDLTAAEFSSLYVTPIANAISSRGLTNIDYIATLGQPSRYTVPSSKNSFTYGLSLLSPFAAGLNTDYGEYKVTGLYSNPSSIPVNSNSAIYHSQHYSINYGAGGTVDTQYYMAGALGYTWVGGNTADQVIAGLTRAVGADGTHPTGTIYFEENDDIRSNTRESEWPATKSQLDSRGIPWLQERNVSGATPLNRNNVLGAVIGSAGYVAPNGSTYVAGSWADNLTSYGATWDDRGQTKDSRLIASGVIATTGSVIEPYANSYRFTNSSIYTFLADGSSAAEAFYKSVAEPDIQFFMGDLLAQPSADVPAVSITSGPAEGSSVSGTVSIGVAASLTGAKIVTGISRLELLVDGVLNSTISGASGTFNLATTSLSDGRHQLRLVAVNNAAAESEGYVLRNVVVNNHGRSAGSSAGTVTITGTASVNVPVSAVAGDGTVSRIELRCLGRSLGQYYGTNGNVRVGGTQLAYGDNLLTPVAIFSDGSQVAGAPITVHRDAVYLAGQSITPNLTAGLKTEYFFNKGGGTIVGSDFSGAPDLTINSAKVNLWSGLDTSGLDKTPDALATSAIDKLAIRMSGKFNVAVDQAGEYQFYLWKTNDSAKILIDGQQVAAFDNAVSGFTTNQVASVYLGAGEHDFVLLAANLMSSGTDTRFDISAQYRGPDGITRIVDSSSFGFLNSAPALDTSGALQLPAIAEDDTANPGVLVSDLLASAGGTPISDPDAGALAGIAITGADYTNGMWQYKIGSGGSWTDLPRASNAAARLLAADAATWIRFVPASNWNGTVSNGITFRAWDRSSGSPGTSADTTVNGGNTAFSTAVETASITVTPVADAPAVAAGAVDATMVADTGITPLRLGNLEISPGGADEQATQTLTFTVTAVPDPARGSIIRAGDTTPLLVGQFLTADELRGLRFMAASGSSANADTFSFVASESGSGGLATPFTVPLDIVHRNPISLLGDLETTTDSSDPANFVELNGIAYFSAFDMAHGSELWRSDGTAAGTWLLKDIQPGTRGASITNMTAVGNLVFFSANDGINGQELWATDGTPGGTYMVRDINAGLASSGVANNSSPANLVAMGGVLYFTASSGSGTELMRSDGSWDGTYVVKDIYAGSGSASPARLTVNGSTIYFTATDGVNGTELWKSDGTAAGTVLVKDITAGSGGSTFTAMAAAGGTVFFALTDATYGNELWKSDGTAGGTSLLKDIYGGATSSSPSNFVAIGSTLFFTAADAANGTEVWKSDGTIAGTLMLADIYTGSTGSAPALLTNVNGTLFFRAADTTTGAELWMSDGTSVTRVADIYSGSTGSTPANLVNVSGTLFFTATASGTGTELWKSDGTPGGTVIVKDLVNGSGSGSYANLASVNGKLFFRGSMTSVDRELWTSDGSAGGTVLVKDIAANSTVTSNPNSLVAFNNKLYFIATTLATGTELWVSDGTVAGTTMLKDINLGAASAGVANLRVAGGRLYFSANNGASGAELWSSDGTAAGTALVKDIYSGSSSSSPGNFVDVSGTVYFTANDGVNGIELWKTDGTAGGTVMVKDITSGSGSSTISAMVALGSKLLFACTDSTNGTELWSSDGTATGTALLKDINPGTASSSPASPFVFGGRVYFAANDGTTGTEVWSSDGTATGTTRYYDIYSGATSSSPDQFAATNGILFFAATDPTYGREVFRLGTINAYAAGDANPGATSAYPYNLTGLGTALYYAGYSPTYGYELWKTTGSTGYNSLVADIRPGASGSNLGSMTVLGNQVFFRADDGVTGPELWVINGATSTASRFADILPGSTDAFPQLLTAAGSTLFFRGADAVAGDEVWAWSDIAPTTGAIADRSMTVASGGATVNLWSAFDDDVDLDSRLVYSVTGNTNSALVGTSIDAATGVLTLTSKASVAGSSRLTVRATDRRGQYVETSFNVSQSAPVATVGLSSASPATGDILTATATKSDADGDTVTLTYVWKVNGNVRRTFASATSLTDTFNLGVSGNGDTGDVITVEVTPSDGLLTGATVSATATVRETPPNVTAVKVNSTQWTASSPAYGGYAIPAGAAQLAPLPWSNINQVLITFDEPVNVTQGALAIRGVNQADYVPSAFTYDANTYTATWTLAAPVGDDKLLLALAASGSSGVTDLAGNALDGEWTSGSSSFPSGNGAAGGDFTFNFSVLSGDISGSGKVDFADLVVVSQNYRKTGATWSQGDLNGDGTVNFADLVIVSQNYKRGLPAGEPATASAPAAFAPVAVDFGAPASSGMVETSPTAVEQEAAAAPEPTELAPPITAAPETQAVAAPAVVIASAPVAESELTAAAVAAIPEPVAVAVGSPASQETTAPVISNANVLIASSPAGAGLPPAPVKPAVSAPTASPVRVAPVANKTKTSSPAHAAPPKPSVKPAAAAVARFSHPTKKIIASPTKHAPASRVPVQLPSKPRAALFGTARIRRLDDVLDNTQ